MSHLTTGTPTKDHYLLYWQTLSTTLSKWLTKYCLITKAITETNLFLWIYCQNLD